MHLEQVEPSDAARSSQGGRTQGRLRGEEAPGQGGRWEAVPDPAGPLSYGQLLWDFEQLRDKQDFRLRKC